MLKVTVRDWAGVLLYQAVKPQNGKSQKAIRAAHTRYTNQAMRQFYDRWRTIHIEAAE